MNIQEQEERDYYPMSDLQMAYAVSRQEFESLDPMITEALNIGLAVIAVARPAYCPRTDAAMGEYHCLVSAYPTAKAAEEALKAMKIDEYDEAYYYVRSLKEQ